MEQLHPATVVIVLVVLAWLSTWYYNHTAHQRAQAEAVRQAEFDKADAVEKAVRGEREKQEGFEPRHDPALHKQFVERVDYERDREEIHREFARQAVARRGVYTKIEEQGLQIAKLQTASDTQSRQLAQLDGKIEDLPEKILRFVDRKP